MINHKLALAYSGIRGKIAESGWVLAGQLGAAFGALLGVKLLTSVVSPSVYGQVALGLTACVFLNQMASGPLAASLLRQYSAATTEGQGWALLLAARRLLRYIFLAIVLLGFIAAGVTAYIYGLHLFPLVFAIAALAIFQSRDASYLSFIHAARWRKTAALHQSMAQVLRFLFAFVGVILFGQSATIIVVGFVFAYLVTSTSLRTFVNFLPALDQENGPDWRGVTLEWQKRLVSYALPFSYWGVFTWAQLASDRISLEVFSSSADVGKYVALYQLGFFPASMMSNAVSQFAAPIIFQRVESSKKLGDPNSLEKYKARTFHFGLVLLAAVTTIAVPLGPPFFRLLTGQAYWGVAHLIPFVVLAGGLFGLGQLLSQFVLAERDSRSLLPPKIVLAVLGVILNVVGAWLWKVSGIVAALVVVNALYALWIHVINLQSLPSRKIG